MTAPTPSAAADRHASFFKPINAENTGNTAPCAAGQRPRPLFRCGAQKIPLFAQDLVVVVRNFCYSATVGGFGFPSGFPAP